MAASGTKKKKKWIKWVVIAGVVVLIFIIFSIYSMNAANNMFEDDPVTKRDIQTYHSFTGTVSPVTEENVVPKLTGLKIEKYAVEEGDEVKAGDVLVYLDASSIEDQIDMYRLFSHRLQENAIFPETRLRILCGLLASGYREASFLAAVRRSRPHLLAYAIRSDDVPALRAILRDAPLSDRDLETLIVRAAEQDAKACYIVLVDEKKKRGLLVDGERRL